MLTDAGREQCKTMRRFLQDLGASPTIIICSEMRRAAETAERMNKHLRVPVVQLAALNPDGDAARAWKAIIAAVKTHEAQDQHILAITHDPLIMPMLAAACFGFSAEHNIFDHASICHFHTGEHALPDEGVEAGSQQLKWFATPKTASKLRESLAAAAVAEQTIRVAEHLLRKSRRTVLEPFEKSFRHLVKTYLAGTIPWQPNRITELLQWAYDEGVKFALPMLPSIFAEADKKQTSATAILLTLGLGGPDRDQYNIQSDLDASTSTADVESRSLMTAITEISTAYHNGMADLADSVSSRGIEVQKRWLAQPDACPECEENADDGWIPEDIMFANDEEPPGHPSCRCSLEYRER